MVLYGKKIRSGEMLNISHSCVFSLIFKRSKIFVAVKEGFKIIDVISADGFGGSYLYIGAETAEP